MIKKATVAIKSFGETLIHIDGRMGPGNYATLCGMDGFDSHHTVDQEVVQKSGKIDCPDCIQIWQACRSISPRDIDPLALNRTLARPKNSLSGPIVG